MSHLLISLAVQPGVGDGDSDGWLGRPFHGGLVVLGGDIASSPSAVRLVAPQLLNVVHQGLLEATRRHTLCLFVASVTCVGHHDLALGPSLNPASHA